jgi:hypothetical protein
MLIKSGLLHNVDKLLEKARIAIHFGTDCASVHVSSPLIKVEENKVVVLGEFARELVHQGLHVSLWDCRISAKASPKEKEMRESAKENSHVVGVFVQRNTCG